MEQDKRINVKLLSSCKECMAINNGQWITTEAIIRDGIATYYCHSCKKYRKEILIG